MDKARISFFPIIEYTTSTPLYEDADERFVMTITGKILGEIEGYEKFVHLGDLKILRIQLGNAVNNRVSAYDVFDTEQSTMDLGCALFDFSSGEFKSVLQNQYDCLNPYDDLLVLDRLTLDPAVRGQRLGLAVLHRAMEDWSGGCSLVVMKPYPLQYEGGSPNREKIAEYRLEMYGMRRAEAFKNLRDYYAELGFKRVGRSEYFARSVERPLPPWNRIRIPDDFTIPAEFLEGKGA